MAVKLIAIDLDGTLFNDSKKVSFYNRWMIKKALKQGIKVTLATGRPYGFSRDVAQKLGSEVGVMAHCGAYCTFGNYKNCHPFSAEQLAHILELNQEFLVELRIETENEIYVVGSKNLGSAFPFGPHIPVHYLKKDLKKEEVLQTVLSQPIYTIVVHSNGNHEQFNRFTAQIKAGKGYEIADFASHSYDITVEQATKGLALGRLASYLKIDVSEVAVIGDSQNDLSMFKVAGHKIAMANALPVLKEMATFVTADNNHSGLGKAIKYLLQ